MADIRKISTKKGPRLLLKMTLLEEEFWHNVNLPKSKIAPFNPIDVKWCSCYKFIFRLLQNEALSSYWKSCQKVTSKLIIEQVISTEGKGRQRDGNRQQQQSERGEI